MFKNKDDYDASKMQVIVMSRKYMCYEGLLNEADKYIETLGDRVLISGGKRALTAVEDSLSTLSSSKRIKCRKYLFTGECCKKNIIALEAAIKNMRANVLVGIGGGKSLDTAKATAERCKIPIVCIPTIAATCAAVSSISVLYKEDGEYEKDIYLSHAPDLVLVDPAIILRAPLEYLQSGVFDSLAKWYEGAAAIKKIESVDIFSVSALKLAENLNIMIKKEAKDAIKAAVDKELNTAFINIVNGNICMAGLIQMLGKTTIRGAAAHSVCSSLSLLEECREVLHGFKVAFGILIQMIIETYSQEQIKDTVRFFDELGAGAHLRHIDSLLNDKKILEMVSLKAISDPLMKNMPIKIKEENIADAIRELKKLLE